MNKSSLPLLKRLLITALISFLCASAHADPITFNFTAVITDVQVGSSSGAPISVSIGSLIPGSFTLDGGVVTHSFFGGNFDIHENFGDAGGQTFSGGILDVVRPGGYDFFAHINISEGGMASFSLVYDPISNFTRAEGHLVSLTETVPDTGTTFSLFGLSLMGLVFLRRKLG